MKLIPRICMTLMTIGAVGYVWTTMYVGVSIIGKLLFVPALCGIIVYVVLGEKVKAVCLQ